MGELDRADGASGPQTRGSSGLGGGVIGVRSTLPHDFEDGTMVVRETRDDGEHG